MADFFLIDCAQYSSIGRRQPIKQLPVSRDIIARMLHFKLHIQIRIGRSWALLTRRYSYTSTPRLNEYAVLHIFLIYGFKQSADVMRMQPSHGHADAYSSYLPEDYNLTANNRNLFAVYNVSSYH